MIIGVYAKGVYKSVCFPYPTSSQNVNMGKRNKIVDTRPLPNGPVAIISFDKKFITLLIK